MKTKKTSGRRQTGRGLTASEFESLCEAPEPTDLAARPPDSLPGGDWAAVCLACYLDDCHGQEQPTCPARRAARLRLPPETAADAAYTALEVGHKLALSEAERGRLYDWLLSRTAGA